MPTTGEVIIVAVGVGLMICFIIAFPILALVCRHLRGRKSQIRRWGTASHLLVPPCYCYVTVWAELFPCLEPHLQALLPKDISKTGQVSLVMVDTNDAPTKSVTVRQPYEPPTTSFRKPSETPTTSFRKPSETPATSFRKPSETPTASFRNASSEVVPPPAADIVDDGDSVDGNGQASDDVISDGGQASKFVRITVASSDTDLSDDIAVLDEEEDEEDVVDHGHVNMAMTQNDESEPGNRSNETCIRCGSSP